MSQQMAERAAALFNTPGLGDYLYRFDTEGVEWAISGSAAAYLLTGNRPPSDIDLTVSGTTADAAFGVSPEDASPHVGPEAFRCGDGLVLDFPAKGLSFVAGVGELAVDVMNTGDAQGGDHVYRLGLSDLALKHRLKITVEGPRGPQAVYVANPFDIIAMKAVMQRGLGTGRLGADKFDFFDIEAILQTCGIDPEYAVTRAREIGLTGREWSYLGRAGLLASIYSVRA